MEAARQLREAKYANLIVGLTGAALDSEVNEFLGSGADLVLTKPLRQGHLLGLIAYTRSAGYHSTGAARKLSMVESDRADGTFEIVSNPWGQ